MLIKSAKEVKDLVALDFDNENKKDTPKKKEKEIIMEENKEVEVIDEPNIEELINEPIRENKIKKHFKYEDGKIKYINLFNTKRFKKEGFSLKDTTENIKNEIKVEKKRLDKRSILNKILIVFIIFSIIFTYFYYFKDTDISDINTSNNETLEGSNNEAKGEENFLNEDKGKEDEKGVTKDELISDIKAEVKSINTMEVKRINDYLDIKGNRVSTQSSVKDFKSSKEQLYRKLVINKELFKKDEGTYFELEELIIKSIAMSQEFLAAFEEGGNKISFKDIIDKYRNS